MKEIDFEYFINNDRFKIDQELKNKDIFISGYITNKCILKSQKEEYMHLESKYGISDYIYIGMVEKKCDERYKVFCLGKDIHFITTKKFIDKYKNILYKFNFRFFPAERIIYLGGFLKYLLENNGYNNYEGFIRVYGKYGSVVSNERNIGKIWKADILDEDGNIVETIEDKKRSK